LSNKSLKIKKKKRHQSIKSQCEIIINETSLDNQRVVDEIDNSSKTREQEKHDNDNFSNNSNQNKLYISKVYDL
jgi:hypothetical protein